MTRRSLALLFARTVLGVVATLTLGCASFRPPLTCRQRGGPPWSVLASKHLILRTDVDPGAARGMLARFEAVYDALSRVMPRPRRAPGVKVEVVVFDRQEDYAALAWPARWSGGMFTPKLDADFEPRPVAVFYDDPRVDAQVVFAHELAHRFLRERFRSLPPWLDEGLAQLHSTVRVDGDRIVLGEALPLAYRDLAEPPTVRELLATGKRELDDRARRRRFYAAAFRLCHLLSSRAPERFSSFLDDVERGLPHREAFDRRFDPDDPWLQAAYRGYPDTGLPTRSIPYAAPPEAPPAHRILGDAAVHLLWARVRHWDPSTREAVARDLDEALARAPSAADAAEARYVRARLLVDAGREEDAGRELDAALASRPDEPRYLHARLLVGAATEEASGALLERLSRVAATAAELGLVAERYGLARERVNEALIFAERALRADPMCWQCEKTRSRILFLGRRYDEAVRAADRGLVLVPEGERAAELGDERAFFARLRDAERGAPTWSPPHGSSSPSRSSDPVSNEGRARANESHDEL